MAARRRSARHHEEEPENHERWLISYADMITLLMVFFIVLFSMSSIDMDKYRAVVESFSQATGGGRSVMFFPTDKDRPRTERGEPTPAPTATPSPGPSAIAMAMTLEKLQQERDLLAAAVTSQVAAAGLSRDVSVTVDERGVVLLLTNSLLFPEAQARLLSRGQKVLGTIAPMLASSGKPIVVEGHTDSRPIGSAQFPSNWELSTARATNVLRTLISDDVPSARLTAAGYADTHPRRPNSTASGMAKNRRVEIILVVSPSTSRPAAGGDDERA